MALQIKVKITPENIGEIWKSRMAGLADRLNAAVTAAANMAASLIEVKAKTDIASAGNFGSRWTDGLHVEVEGEAPANMILSMTHDIPWAGIFETGGTISGDLLWIPLSGTDAAGIRASAFPAGLFSAKYPRQNYGVPLLFSMQDKKPRYFGIESVTIPKKFQLTEDVTSVMANFRAIFDDAWKAA